MFDNTEIPKTLAVAESNTILSTPLLAVVCHIIRHSVQLEIYWMPNLLENQWRMSTSRINERAPNLPQWRRTPTHCRVNFATQNNHDPTGRSCTAEVIPMTNMTHLINFEIKMRYHAHHVSFISSYRYHGSSRGERSSPDRPQLAQAFVVRIGRPKLAWTPETNTSISHWGTLVKSGAGHRQTNLRVTLKTR